LPSRIRGQESCPDLPSTPANARDGGDYDFHTISRPIRSGPKYPTREKQVFQNRDTGAKHDRSSRYEWQIGLCCSCRPTLQLRHQQVVWQQKRDLRASVQRRRRALDFDIELQEPIEQRGLPKEVASAISVAQGCVASVLKQAEPEQRSEDSCLHRH